MSVKEWQQMNRNRTSIGRLDLNIQKKRLQHLNWLKDRCWVNRDMNLNLKILVNE